MIGSLFALPYMLLWFAGWIASSLFRPLLVMSLVCVLTNGPGAALRKAQLFFQTFQYMILCKDKKWEKTPDPQVAFDKAGSDSKVETKTIIFVRHGESTWNDTFNKGDRKTTQFVQGFFPGLLKAIYYEWYFWVSGQANESWFFDAPLSAKGLAQAQSIQTYLRSKIDFMPPKEQEFVRLLLGEGATRTRLVSSNLRRAIATMAVGFQDRLQKRSKDKIVILPCLQEVSRNPDALSITPAYGKLLPAFCDPPVLTDLYETHVDTSMHYGNKKLNSNGLKRLNEFCKIVFEDIEEDTVIAAGHSLWFRSFFREFLPHSVAHVSKQKKLKNGGVVRLTLQRVKLDGKYRYLVDHTSVHVMHGGF